MESKKLSHRVVDVFLWVAFVLLLLMAILTIQFPAQDYSEQIQRNISIALGHKVRISGEKNWVVIPSPGVYIERVTIDSLGLELQEAFIAVSPWALLQLQVKASHLEVARMVAAGTSNLRIQLSNIVVGLNNGSDNRLEFVLGVEDYESGLAAKQWLFSGQLLRDRSDRFELKGEFQRQTLWREQRAPVSQSAYRLFASLSADGGRQGDIERRFELTLHSSQADLSVLGNIYRQDSRLQIEIDKLLSTNLNLKGNLNWNDDGSWGGAAFFGDELRVPTSCFDLLAETRPCRDLILLFSMPGQSSLKLKRLFLGGESLVDNQPDKLHSVNTKPNETASNDTPSREYQFNDLQMFWQGEKKLLQISKITAEAFGGRLEGDAIFDRLQNSIDFSLQIDDVDVEQAAAWLPADRYLSGSGNITMSGTGRLDSREYQILGETKLTHGEIKTFSLQEQLCRHFVKDLHENDTVTPYKEITARFNLNPARWYFESFKVQMDGASIEGDGELLHNRKLRLDMDISVQKREWSLCTLPHALTTTEWPFNCVGVAVTDMPMQNSCSVDFTQLGFNALKMIDDDQMQARLDRLKSKDKVKKVLERLDRWLEE